MACLRPLVSAVQLFSPRSAPFTVCLVLPRCGVVHLLAPAVVGGVVVYLAALEVACRLSADTPPVSAL